MRAGRGKTPEARAAGAQAGRARSEGDEVPEVLRRRFEHFREQSAPRTRVPQTLRRAVLEAVEQGVSMQALRRELGLTHTQMRSWQREVSRPAKEVSVANGVPRVRAFEVVEPPVSGESAMADDRVSSVVAGEALELRLGGWSLVIRATSR